VSDSLPVWSMVTFPDPRAGDLTVVAEEQIWDTSSTR